MKHLENSLLDLIRRACRELSHDVLLGLEKAYKAEDPKSSASVALAFILENIELARAGQLPLTAGPVWPHFYVVASPGLDTHAFQAAAESALTVATTEGLLPEALVDPVTGRVARGNVGAGTPTFHYRWEDRKSVEVRFLADGGVDLFTGAQVVLPEEAIAAGRDLNGVRRAVLDCLVRTQGSGAGPGIVGVGIGGDRATGFALAHEQLLRPLNDRNRNKALADLEKRICEDANTLGIGPLGLGGKHTLLAAKVGAQACTAAHCMVSVCYSGWVHLRQGVELDSNGAVATWLYESTPETRKALVEPPEEVDEAAASAPSAQSPEGGGAGRARPRSKSLRAAAKVKPPAPGPTAVESNRAAPSVGLASSATRKASESKQAPTAKESTAKAPTAKAPTAKTLNAKAPAAKAPAAKAPAAKAPAAKAPAAKAPAAKSLPNKAPVAKDPVTQTQSASTSAAKAPVAKPSTTKPPASKPPALKPPTPKPTKNPSVVDKSAVDENEGARAAKGPRKARPR